jgi:hypothetical protein
MISLEALTARVTTEVAAKAALKEVQAKVKKAPAGTARDEAAAEAAQLSSFLDWRPVALVLGDQHITCKCGQDHWAVLGLFVLDEHVRFKDATRLRAVPAASHGELLPRKTWTQDRTVEFCYHCCEEAGFTEEYTAARHVSARLALPVAPGPFRQEWLDKTAPLEEDDAPALSGGLL